MKKTSGLKHPSPVSEAEFSEYLSKVCPNTEIRRHIFSYYKFLKRLDHKLGKHLSSKSFFSEKFDIDGVAPTTDQVLYLFSKTPLDRALNQKTAKFVKKAHCFADKYVPTKTAKNLVHSHIDTLRQKQLSLFYFRAKDIRIGKADFFKWQFVNLIDEIDENSTNKTARAAINILFKKLKVYVFDKIDDNATASEKEIAFSRNKETIFHELTHLMSATTFFDGKFYSLAPIYAQAKKRTCISIPDCWLDENHKLTVSPKAFSFFKKGIVILQEITTQLYTAKLLSNQRFYFNGNFLLENFTNSAYGLTVTNFQTKCKENENTYIENVYSKLGYLLEMISDFYMQDRLCHDPRHNPTDPQFIKIEKFWKDSVLSPEVEELVDKTLQNALGIKPEHLKFEKNMNSAKFTMLMGLLSEKMYAHVPNQNYFKQTGNFDPRFHPYAVVIETMIIDSQRNHLKNNIQTFLSGDYQQDKTNAYFSALTKNLGYVDDWVIKPNLKNETSTNETIFAKYHLSNAHLSALFPKNLLLKTWAQTIQEFATACQKHAPEVFNKSKFLKSELKAKQDLESKKDFSFLDARYICTTPNLIENAVKNAKNLQAEIEQERAF